MSPGLISFFHGDERLQSVVLPVLTYALFRFSFFPAMAKLLLLAYVPFQTISIRLD